MNKCDTQCHFYVFCSIDMHIFMSVVVVLSSEKRTQHIALHILNIWLLFDAKNSHTRSAVHFQWLLLERNYFCNRMVSVQKKKRAKRLWLAWWWHRHRCDSNTLIIPLLKWDCIVRCAWPNPHWILHDDDIISLIRKMFHRTCLHSENIGPWKKYGKLVPQISTLLSIFNVLII